MPGSQTLCRKRIRENALTSPNFNPPDTNPTRLNLNSFIPEESNRHLRASGSPNRHQRTAGAARSFPPSFRRGQG